MARAADSLAHEPSSVSDHKYGVHGGRDQVGTGSSTAVLSSPTKRGRIFYCGGALRNVGTIYFKYSTFGLFLANSLFPDFEGRIEIQPGTKVVKTSAVALTDETSNGATADDLLIVHSHQHCEVAVEGFPGRQLHINVSRHGRAKSMFVPVSFAHNRLLSCMHRANGTICTPDICQM